jgi:hypothetical protein
LLLRRSTDMNYIHCDSKDMIARQLSPELVDMPRVWRAANGASTSSPYMSNFDDVRSVKYKRNYKAVEAADSTEGAMIRLRQERKNGTPSRMIASPIDDRTGCTSHRFTEMAKAATPKTSTVQGYPSRLNVSRVASQARVHKSPPNSRSAIPFLAHLLPQSKHRRGNRQGVGCP